MVEAEMQVEVEVEVDCGWMPARTKTDLLP